MGNGLPGEFGQSYSGLTGSMRRGVSATIAPRLYNPFFLAAMAAIVSVPLALFLGVMAALYRNSWFDRIVNSITLTTIAMPEFFIAYILVYVLAVKLRWFYPNSTVSIDTPFFEHVYRAALPAITMTLVIIAHMMRMTRAAIINLLASPYIEMAQLKGVSKSQVIVHHALPNAWAPIATVIAFNLAYLVAGVVTVEEVFVYTGIGQRREGAVSSRDQSGVPGCARIFAPP